MLLDMLGCAHGKASHNAEKYVFLFELKLCAMGVSNKKVFEDVFFEEKLKLFNRI